LAGRKQLCWNWLPANKTVGGILMGVNFDIFAVDSSDIRTFSFSCVLINKKDKMRSIICIVYGSAYEEKKQDFIDELNEIGLYKEPLLIGGL
jgi:hypothetical protein